MRGRRSRPPVERAPAPTSALGHVARGLSELTSENPAAAIAHFERVAAFADENGFARCPVMWWSSDLIECYVAEGMIEQARAGAGEAGGRGRRAVDADHGRRRRALPGPARPGRVREPPDRGSASARTRRHAVRAGPDGVAARRPPPSAPPAGPGSAAARRGAGDVRAVGRRRLGQPGPAISWRRPACGSGGPATDSATSPRKSSRWPWRWRAACPTRRSPGTCSSA